LVYTYDSVCVRWADDTAISLSSMETVARFPESQLLTLSLNRMGCGQLHRGCCTGRRVLTSRWRRRTSGSWPTHSNWFCLRLLHRRHEDVRRLLNPEERRPTRASEPAAVCIWSLGVDVILQEDRYAMEYPREGRGMRIELLRYGQCVWIHLKKRVEPRAALVQSANPGIVRVHNGGCV